MRPIAFCGLVLAILLSNILRAADDPAHPTAEQLAAAKEAYARIGAKYGGSCTFFKTRIFMVSWKQ